MSEFDNAEAEQSLQDSHSKLTAIKEGRVAELGQLAESLRPYLKQVVRRELPLGNLPDDQSDIVQQVLLKAVSNLNTFRGSSLAEWRGWLAAIAKNEVKMSHRYWASAKRAHYRSAAIDMVDQLAGDENSPSAELKRAEAQMQLDQALALLTDDQRQIIHWRQTDQLAHTEIAARLEITVEAARQRCKSAMDALRARFREVAGQGDC